MTNNATREFWATLEKSNLLTPEQMVDARETAGEADDPTAIARLLIRKDLLTRWQAGQLLAGRSSFFLGKYKLIELLGRGGMGHVFLGEHTTMNRRVALKIVSRKVRKDPASLQRFLSEARAIAALDHPNIVQAYSVDNEADRYYIVMEYVDGTDLQRLVKDHGPLDYETAADCIRQAAEGLAHGHRRKMIHCDVKPSNLLVNEQGVVKIVDMGLSRLAGPDEGGSNGQDDRVLGSVDYLAPEQALESCEFDHRADIYSLGCTFYFLLTGRPPFPEGSLHERLMKHQTQQPQGIREQRSDAPRELVELCEKMMAKKAEDRPQSAEQISRTLAEWRPPATESKPRAPLKVAKSLEQPVAEELPSIRIDVKPGAAKSGVAKKRTSSKKTRFLQTPRQKAVAGVVVLLVAGALLAAAIPFLGDSNSQPPEDTRAQAKSTGEGDGQTPAGPEKTPSPDQPEEDEPITPSPEVPQERPAHQPAEKPADDPPQVDDEPPLDAVPDDKPAEDVPAERKPDEEKQPDDKPADDPPLEPEPKPEEPKKVDPFGELAGAVELQLLDPDTDSQGQSGTGSPLGKLHLAPNASCRLELIGGDNALKGNRQFALRRSGDGQSWLVHLASEAATEPNDLARIWHHENTLMFQWLDAATPESANYLCNCALNIHVSGKKRLLRLSKTLQADPLVVDFSKRIILSKVKGRFLPDPSKLRLELTGWEGEFPPHRLQPEHPVTPKQSLNVFLDGKDRHGNVQPMMQFQLRWAARGDELNVTLRLAQPHTADLLRLQNEADRNRARTFYSQAEEQLKKEKDRRKKAQLEAALNLWAGPLWYAEQYEKLQQKGKIHFRIFVDPGEGGGPQIELVNTRPSSDQPSKNG